jgi:hypothetical protein
MKMIQKLMNTELAVNNNLENPSEITLPSAVPLEIPPEKSIKDIL